MRFQANSLMSATASTAYSINFGPNATTVQLISTGRFYVRPTAGAATLPTSPVATGLVSGWLVLEAGDKIQLGVDGGLQSFDGTGNPVAPGGAYNNAVSGPVVTSSPNLVPDTIGGLQIWCDATGNLKVLAH